MSRDPMVANANAQALVRMVDTKLDATELEKRLADLLQEAIDQGFIA